MTIHRNPKEYDLPKLDLLTFLFDSQHSLAVENTPIHAEAADPRIIYTKAQARAHVQRLAYTLRHSYGIGAAGPGSDVIVVISSGQAYLPVALFATIAAGGVYSAASSVFTAEELSRQILDGPSNLIICSRDVLDVAIRAADACGIASNRVLILESSPVWMVCEAASGKSVLGAGWACLDWERITDEKTLAERTICLLYSSGTTGLPKGVRLTNKNIVSQSFIPGQMNREYLANREVQGDPPFEWRTLSHLPSSHVAGLMGFMINPFFQGGLTYWMPKFDFDLFVRYNKQFRITYFVTVPPIYLLMAKDSKVTDQFANMRYALTGAAPMGAELQQAAAAKVGDRDTCILQTWGLTESTGSATLMPWGRQDLSGSVGEILPNFSLRIVNDNHEDLPLGTPGEILLKGPSVFQDYHNRTYETAKSFIDGWFCTGDIGEMRGNLLYIVDRKKELIKYKGYQVAPAELEALLLSNERIFDAAVIGVEQEGTEVPRAFIVADQSNISEQEIKEFVKKQVSAYKQLRGGVTFVDTIPKSASGKILRKDLRERVRKESRSKL